MHWRRKKKFIDPKTQLSFAGWLTIYAITFFLLVLFVMFIPPLANWFNPGIDYRSVMTDFFTLLKGKWPLLLLIVAITVIGGNFFSHRLVGPEFRFKQVLRSLKNRELDVFLRLRKWDYLKGLEVEFKEFIRFLKSDVTTLKRSVKDIEDSLNANDTARAKESLNKMKADLEKYKYEEESDKK